MLLMLMLTGVQPGGPQLRLQALAGPLRLPNHCAPQPSSGAHGCSSGVQASGQKLKVQLVSNCVHGLVG